MNEGSRQLSPLCPGSSPTTTPRSGNGGACGIVVVDDVLVASLCVGPDEAQAARSSAARTPAPHAPALTNGESTTPATTGGPAGGGRAPTRWATRSSARSQTRSTPPLPGDARRLTSPHAASHHDAGGPPRHRPRPGPRGRRPSEPRDHPGGAASGSRASRRSPVTTPVANGDREPTVRDTDVCSTADGHRAARGASTRGPSSTRDVSMARRTKGTSLWTRLGDARHLLVQRRCRARRHRHGEKAGLPGRTETSRQ